MTAFVHQVDYQSIFGEQKDYRTHYIHNTYLQCGNNTQVDRIDNEYAPSHSDFQHKKQRITYTRTRSAANLRERKRMKCINEAFEGLRKHIPTLPYEKRLSKVDTLRLAICYINFLNELVTADTTMQQRDRSNLSIKEENQGKIVILNTTKDRYDGLTRVRGHSLSWSFDREDPKKSNRVKTAKIWWPEQATQNNRPGNDNYSTGQRN